MFVAISKAWDPGPLLASYALDSGAELWSMRNPTGPPLDESSMVISPDGDTLYTLVSTLDAGYGASVAAWDANTGVPQWMGRMLSPSGDALSRLEGPPRQSAASGRS